MHLTILLLAWGDKACKLDLFLLQDSFILFLRA